jgi:hypothetical protein
VIDRRVDHGAQLRGESRVGDDVDVGEAVVEQREETQHDLGVVRAGLDDDRAATPAAPGPDRTQGSGDARDASFHTVPERSAKVLVRATRRDDDTSRDAGCRTEPTDHGRHRALMGPLAVHGVST